MFIGILLEFGVSQEAEVPAAISWGGVKMIPAFPTVNKIPPMMTVQTRHLNAWDPRSA